MAPSDANGFFSGPVGVCVSAKAVYGWFKEGNPQVTDAGGETWDKVSGLQTEISTLINKAVNDSGASWSGTAGDAMRSSTSPMATWADMTGTSANAGSSATAEISSAFRAAQNSVQQPVEVPDKPWYNSVVPWDTDYDDAVEKSQGVDEANMRVINAYADRTNYASSNMPTFEAPADSTAEIDDTGSEPPKKVDYSHESNGELSNNQTDPGGSSNSSNTNQGRNDVFTPSTNDTNGNSDNPNGTTNPSDTDGTTRPSDVNDPNRPPVGTPGRPPTGTPGGIGDPGGPGVVGPFGPNDPRNPANKLGGGSGGGRGGGAGGGGLGGGSRGGLGGGPGGGGAGAGAGGIGAGRGGLSGPGAAAAAGQFGGAAGAAGEGAGRGGAFGAAGGAAGGRGAAGGAGAMGGAGHGGKGEGGDDLEHTSKYLQPSDEYFGDGTMVAPPVIGG